MRVNKLLLDTHVFLWWRSNDQLLQGAAKSAIADADTDRLVAVTSAGRMLVIPANDLPELTRGKGNKIIGIPSKAVAERSEYVVDIVAVPQGGRLRLNSGKRHLNLRAADLNAYEG